MRKPDHDSLEVRSGAHQPAASQLATPLVTGIELCASRAHTMFDLAGTGQQKTMRRAIPDDRLGLTPCEFEIQPAKSDRGWRLPRQLWELMATEAAAALAAIAAVVLAIAVLTAAAPQLPASNSLPRW